MSSTSRRVIATLLIVATSSLAGCVANSNDRAVGNVQSFEATEKAWPPLPGGSSRIVLYWPRLPYIEGLPIGSSGAGYVALKVSLDGNGPVTGEIKDQTFVFADVSPGAHRLELSGQGTLFSADTQVFPFEVNRGETAYIKVFKTLADKTPPKVVDPKEGRADIIRGNIRHFYRQPLPLNTQPK